ncbi:MAG: hypothetical protein HQ518_31030 [Rhodopirellula sp.]|nr:hypothetical protein [Rhodopirellula sp.]
MLSIVCRSYRRGLSGERELVKGKRFSASLTISILRHSFHSDCQVTSMIDRGVGDYAMASEKENPLPDASGSGSFG